jgi:GNAT superfamily N-acetyltransferase
MSDQLIHTIDWCSPEKAQEAINNSTDPKADAFAKTFVGKANKQSMWDKCKGVFNEQGELMAMSITTVSKREPKCANLQLMHTFANFRRRGIGKLLVEDAFDIAASEGCTYFRVSAERTAVGFYSKCDIPFLGMQKSGTFLALFKLDGNRTDIDEFIKAKALYKPGKLWRERCENPNQLELQTIEYLGENYIYDKLSKIEPYNV